MSDLSLKSCFLV